MANHTETLRVLLVQPQWRGTRLPAALPPGALGPQLAVRQLPSVDACLEALAEGAADVVVLNEDGVGRRSEESLVRVRAVAGQAAILIGGGRGGEQLRDAIVLAHARHRAELAESRLVALVEDVSERAATARALKAERDRTAAIVAAVPDGYVLVIAGRIAEVNESLCRLVGFGRDELIGSQFPWPFWPPEKAERAYEPAPGDGDEPDPDPVELSFVHRDGHRFLAEVRTQRARNPDGTPLGRVLSVRDVSRLRDHEAELERLATEDPLTGLPNRRLFYQRLVGELADAIRHERSLAIALIDLDYFKQINDVHGHLAGDRVLREVAAQLQSVVRTGELLARVGGEEFAWILPEADADGAVWAGDRARRAVEAMELGQVGRLTISVGVALRAELREVTELYARADLALYRAKREGRNRTVLWRPQDSQSAASGSVA